MYWALPPLTMGRAAWSPMRTSAARRWSIMTPRISVWNRDLCRTLVLGGSASTIRSITGGFLGEDRSDSESTIITRIKFITFFLAGWLVRSSSKSSLSRSSTVAETRCIGSSSGVLWSSLHSTVCLSSEGILQKVFRIFDKVFHVYLMRGLQKYVLKKLYFHMAFWG